jgi:hypothetical protein
MLVEHDDGSEQKLLLGGKPRFPQRGTRRSPHQRTG